MALSPYVYFIALIVALFLVGSVVYLTMQKKPKKNKKTPLKEPAPAAKPNPQGCQCNQNPFHGDFPDTEHGCLYGYEWNEQQGVCMPSSGRLPLGYGLASNSRCLNLNTTCAECPSCPREGQCLIPEQVEVLASTGPSCSSPCCNASLSLPDGTVAPAKGTNGTRGWWR